MIGSASSGGLHYDDYRYRGCNCYSGVGTLYTIVVLVPRQRRMFGLLHVIEYLESALQVPACRNLDLRQTFPIDPRYPIQYWSVICSLHCSKPCNNLPKVRDRGRRSAALKAIQRQQRYRSAEGVPRNPRPRRGSHKNCIGWPYCRCSLVSVDLLKADHFKYIVIRANGFSQMKLTLAVACILLVASGVKTTEGSAIDTVGSSVVEANCGASLGGRGCCDRRCMYLLARRSLWTLTSTTPLLQPPGLYEHQIHRLHWSVSHHSCYTGLVPHSCSVYW